MKSVKLIAGLALCLGAAAVGMYDTVPAQGSGISARQKWASNFVREWSKKGNAPYGLMESAQFTVLSAPIARILAERNDTKRFNARLEEIKNVLDKLNANESWKNDFMAALQEKIGK